MNDDGFIAGVICVMYGALFCWMTAVVKNIQIDDLKNEAVKKGCAEYYLDEKHEAQWRWTK